MKLGPVVTALYAVLRPCEHETFAPGWFKDELEKRGIVVTRQSVYEWLNVGLPESREKAVGAVIEELHREAHKKALAGLRSVEKLRPK